MRKIWLSLSLAATMAAAAACSSSSSTPATPCNEDPSQCAKGTTCWPIDAVPTFACIASNASATAGSACKNTVNAATCGDGQYCLETSSASAGVCEPYCNASGASTCPAGSLCATATITGGTGASAPKISVCAPESSGSDAGTGTDSGAQSDSGTTSDAGDGG